MNKLIVISSEVEFNNEIKLIHQLFESGMDIFHLRKPYWKKDEQKKYLNSINEKYLDKIMIHQFHEMSAEFKLRGIHLKERDRNELTAKSTTLTKNNEKNFDVIRLGELNALSGLINTTNRRNPREIFISASFHSYDELLQHNHNFDYCFLSPVFDSISKTNYKSQISYDFKISNEIQKPTYALGGIHKKNIEEVFDRRFYGAAVLGAVWNSENPIEEFITLNALCKNYVHTF